MIELTEGALVILFDDCRVIEGDVRLPPFWRNESAGVAFCAEAKTGKIVYEQRVDDRPGQIYASPVLADGKIYYMARNGKTAVVAAKPQFERLALNEFGDRSTFNASPAVAGGQMFVRSDHHLYCLGKAK